MCYHINILRHNVIKEFFGTPFLLPVFKTFHVTNFDIIKTSSCNVPKKDRIENQCGLA